MSEEIKNKEPAKRKRGRPTGATSRIRINDALKKADAGSIKAIELLESMVGGDVKDATAQQRLTAAIKTVEMAIKYQDILGYKTESELREIIKELQEENKELRAKLEDALKNGGGGKKPDLGLVKSSAS